MKKKPYYVEWGFHIEEATSPEDAARQAWALLKNPETVAYVKADDYSEGDTEHTVITKEILDENLPPRYTLDELLEDAFAVIVGGWDYSPTTIRCAMNDLIDAAEKEGKRFDYEAFDQDAAVAHVKSELCRRHGRS